MENPIRGEGKICINGEDHKLCLTLGALAQLEEALGGGDYSQLQQRLKKPRVNDIILISVSYTHLTLPTIYSV